MDRRAMFIEAVQAAADLPALMRDHASEVEVEEHQFDESYLAFLAKQIELSPRGPEWTAVLMRRRAALLPFCGVPLWRGSVRLAAVYFIVEIDPATGAFVHWEKHDISAE